MAKVNLWLRGARGKFAGASLSKGANGETIAREVVTPANPNTNKQIYQRMIMATVMAAYSAGKDIFDHSFEGKAKGSACQQAFMQRNLLRLRSGVADDLAKMTAGTLTRKNCNHIVVGPKTQTPVPGDFIVSHGSYQQSFFSLKKNGTGLTLGIKPNLENETVAAYASRCGLVEGDIYTLIALSVDLERSPVWEGVNESGSLSSDACDYQYPCVFQFIRMQVIGNLASATTPFVYNAPGALSKLFTITESTLADNETIALNSPVANTFVCSDGTSTEVAPAGATNLEYDLNIGSFAVIRSRFDRDLRSTTSMTTFFNDADDNNALFCGISSGSGLLQWKKATDSIGASDLILESDSNTFVPA